MQKTKLGISVGAFGALMYFSGMSFGYLLTVLLAGYVLFYEENPWLKRTAIKSVSLMVSCSILTVIIGLVPGALEVAESFLRIFGVRFTASKVTQIVYFANSTVEFVRDILFLMLGIKALSQGNIRIPVIDGFADRLLKGHNDTTIQ